MRSPLRSRVLPVVLVALLAALVAPTLVQPVHPPPVAPGVVRVRDDVVYADVLGRVRAGQGYYEAMDAAMVANGIGPVETVRAFRPPTFFFVGGLLPSDHWVFLALLVLVVVATAVLARAMTEPVAALVPGAYLVLVARSSWASPDVWAAALALLAVALAMRRSWWPAVLAVGLAAATRELAALALVGVVWEAWRYRATWRPWAAVLPGLAALAALHVHTVLPRLAPPGTGEEANLLGTGSLWAVLEMAGWPGTVGAVAGPAIVVLAVVRARRTGHVRLVLPPLLLPLCGVLVDRPLWGVLVFPVAAAFAMEAVASRVPHERAAAPQSTTAVVPVVAGNGAV